MNETPTNHQNEEVQFNNAARRVIFDAQEDTSAGEPPLHMTERGKNVLKGAGVVAGLAAVGGIAAGMAQPDGGSYNPDRGEADASISSISLAENANLRYDPNVGTGDENNLIDQLDAAVTVDPESDVRVLHGTENGTWYGVNSEDISTAIPNFDDLEDKDSIVWVNEQNVESIQKDSNS